MVLGDVTQRFARSDSVRKIDLTAWDTARIIAFMPRDTLFLFCDSEIRPANFALRFVSPKQGMKPGFGDSPETFGLIVQARQSIVFVRWRL